MFEIYTLEKKEDLVDFFKEIDEKDFQIRFPIDFNKISDTLDMIEYPMTILYEPIYVDKVFRDSYYLFYAGKYNHIERDCKRLAFFKGNLDETVFYSKSHQDTTAVSENFVGIMILKPLNRGRMGRTILDPTKLKIPANHLRTTEFEFIVADLPLKIKAFPFSSQDGETMTCAETTVWNIVEYFANRYSDYKTILASDITKTLENVSLERSLPTRGLPYDRVSQLLKCFGFSPRKYTNDGWEKVEFKRAFHYYIESGIPIAVGVKASPNIYHSIVCIGHGKQRQNYSKEILTNIDEFNIPYVDSADLYNDYVIMDDNQAPYKVQSYDGLTKYDEPEVKTFVVPLYKRIFLEAQDAKKIVLKILSHKNLSFLKMLPRMEEKIDEDNPLIFRLFLTSSRRFKSFRENNEQNDFKVGLYDTALYPKFVWVAELFTKSSYEKNQAYGEIIIDATAARNSSVEESVIMLRYLSNIGYRLPKELIYDLLKRMERPTLGYNNNFKMYINNLIEVSD